MLGWSTGIRYRHTLEGVPTRPAINGAMLRNKKAADHEGRGLLRLMYRATKPVALVCRAGRMIGAHLNGVKHGT